MSVGFEEWKSVVTFRCLLQVIDQIFTPITNHLHLWTRENESLSMKHQSCARNEPIIEKFCNETVEKCIDWFETTGRKWKLLQEKWFKWIYGWRKGIITRSDGSRAWMHPSDPAAEGFRSIWFQQPRWFSADFLIPTAWWPLSSASMCSLWRWKLENMKMSNSGRRHGNGSIATASWQPFNYAPSWHWNFIFCCPP